MLQFSSGTSTELNWHEFCNDVLFHKQELNLVEKEKKENSLIHITGIKDYMIEGIETMWREKKCLGLFTIWNCQLFERLFTSTNCSLTKLILYECSFTNDQFSQLNSFIGGNKTIIDFSLNSSIDCIANRVDLFRDLIDGLIQNETLNFLSLNNNSINSNHCISIERLLKKNKSITSLDLENNKIDDNGFECIVHGMIVNENVRFLNLKYNYLTTNIMPYLFEILTNNRSLEWLSITPNSFLFQKSGKLLEKKLNYRFVNMFGIPNRKNKIIENDEDDEDNKTSYIDIGDYGWDYVEKMRHFVRDPIEWNEDNHKFFPQEVQIPINTFLKLNMDLPWLIVEEICKYVSENKTF